MSLLFFFEVDPCFNCRLEWDSNSGCVIFDIDSIIGLISPALISLKYNDDTSRQKLGVSD